MPRFDRVACISLERRPERASAFMSRVPPDWQYGQIEMVRAVDGKLCGHPQWWKQGGGAWGCYRSHVRIIEESLNCGLGSVLIFEDDATFCDDFSRRCERFLEAVPDDCGQAYLGGQHLRRPEPISDLVVRASNVNRTHAYSLFGTEAMLEVYRWLNACDQWVDRNHIDHHYGRMHKARNIGCYAPSDWLCGQAADPKSDVSWKQVPERWWQARRSVSMPFVAVIGLHRSGSSCTAMMLHKLGVNMGDRLGGYESMHGGGGEAVGLASICERACRFPSTAIKDNARLHRELFSWVQKRRSRAGGAPVGGKYPHLCAMGDALKAACGDGLRVVHCDRPLDESIDSLKRRSRKCSGWLAVSDEEAEAVQRWLWHKKADFLDSMPKDAVLRVEYERLMSSPAEIVDEMISFLALSPTRDQVKNAVSHVSVKECVT